MSEEEKELFMRWENALRIKAAEYEHTARKRGEVVSDLDLDTVCNEMIAYIAGRSKS